MKSASSEGIQHIMKGGFNGRRKRRQRGIPMRFTAGRLLTYDEMLDIMRSALWGNDEELHGFGVDGIPHEKSMGAQKPSPLPLT